MKPSRLVTGATSVVLATTMMVSTALAAAPSFTDVPSTHWAAPSINTLVEKGIMNGIGNNLFAPDSTITNAEFVTMIVRQFYSDKVESGGDKWYTPYITAAESAGCLAGTDVTSNPESTINRYDMAQIMYNVKKLSTTADTSKISDWASIPANYQTAVSTCYAAGLLTGVDNSGTFGGDNSMTRGQAAAVIDRLSGTATSTPPPPPVSSEIPEGAYILTGDNVTLSGNTMGFDREDTRYENGKFILINSMTNSCAAIEFINEGYSTLTFTCTITSNEEQCIQVSGIDSYIVTDLRLAEYQAPGTTKTYVVNISGARNIALNSGKICSGMEMTNVYLTK